MCIDSLSVAPPGCVCGSMHGHQCHMRQSSALPHVFVRTRVPSARSGAQRCRGVPGPLAGARPCDAACSYLSVCHVYSAHPQLCIGAVHIRPNGYDQVQYLSHAVALCSLPACQSSMPAMHRTLPIAMIKCSICSRIHASDFMQTRLLEFRGCVAQVLWQKRAIVSSN